MTDKTRANMKTAIICLAFGLPIAWYFDLHLILLNAPHELPSSAHEELKCGARLFSGGDLGVDIYNGSKWNIEEIVVRLVVRNEETGAVEFDRVFSQPTETIRTLSNGYVTIRTGHRHKPKNLDDSDSFVSPVLYVPVEYYDWYLESVIGTRKDYLPI